MDVLLHQPAEVFVPASDSDDDELCDELAELFDEVASSDDEQEAGGENVATTDTPPTAEPEKAPEKPAQPGILERLLAKQSEKLNASVAGIVQDARTALDKAKAEERKNLLESAHNPGERGNDNNTNQKTSLADVMRKRRRRTGETGAGIGLTDAQRRKKARNSFAAFGAKAVSVKQEKYAYDDNRFSGMRLRDCPYPESALGGLFETFCVVNIADVADKAVEMRSGALRDVLIFGTLVKKASKRTAKDGKRYAVVILANMPNQNTKHTRKVPPTAINCLLFGDAFDKHHNQPEGTVFALRSPSILPPRDEKKRSKHGNSEWAGHCISVRKADHVVALAHAADFGVCDVENREGKKCGMWFHKGFSSRCHYHAKLLLKKHTSTSRMVINNAERPGAQTKKLFSGTHAAVNLSTDIRANGNHVDRYASTRVVVDDVAKARMRNDNQLKKTLERKLQTNRNNKSLAPDTSRALIKKHRTNVRGRREIGNVNVKQTTLEQMWKTLVGYGYTLRKDGGLEPPSDRRCLMQGITVKQKRPTKSRNIDASNGKSGEGNEFANLIGRYEDNGNTESAEKRTQLRNEESLPKRNTGHCDGESDNREKKGCSPGGVAGKESQEITPQAAFSPTDGDKEEANPSRVTIGGNIEIELDDSSDED